MFLKLLFQDKRFSVVYGNLLEAVCSPQCFAQLHLVLYCAIKSRQKRPENKQTMSSFQSKFFLRFVPGEHPLTRNPSPWELNPAEMIPKSGLLITEHSISRTYFAKFWLESLGGLGIS